MGHFALTLHGIALFNLLLLLLLIDRILVDCNVKIFLTLYSVSSVLLSAISV